MPLRLDALPFEVLIGIASACEALSAINLSVTCHRLREAAWQFRVFRNILKVRQTPWPPRLTEHGVNFWGTRFAAEPTAQVDIEAIDKAAEQDVAIWAKYAVANDCANQFHGGQNQDLREGRVQSMLRWAPHLVFYRHPFLSSAWLALNLKSVMSGEPFDAERAFLYASCMMSITEDGLGMLLEEKTIIDEWVDDARKVGTTPAKAYRALGDFAFVLRTLQHHGVHAPPTPGPHPRPVPSPFGFPTFKPPVPFTDNFTAWHDAYVRSLCTEEYFTSGTWVGTYTEPRIRACDEPMLGIKFRAGVEGDPRSIAANGIDKVGPFQLWGRLRNDSLGHGMYDSELEMFKIYHSHTWFWRCRITPFGLFGTWHAGEGPRAQGNVWLWKEEWMTQKLVTPGRR